MRPSSSQFSQASPTTAFRLLLPLFNLLLLKMIAARTRPTICMASSAKAAPAKVGRSGTAGAKPLEAGKGSIKSRSKNQKTILASAFPPPPSERGRAKKNRPFLCGIAPLPVLESESLCIHGTAATENLSLEQRGDHSEPRIAHARGDERSILFGFPFVVFSLCLLLLRRHGFLRLSSRPLVSSTPRPPPFRVLTNDSQQRNQSNLKKTQSTGRRPPGEQLCRQVCRSRRRRARLGRARLCRRRRRQERRLRAHAHGQDVPPRLRRQEVERG